jgi:hypothetical protein
MVCIEVILWPQQKEMVPIVLVAVRAHQTPALTCAMPRRELTCKISYFETSHIHRVETKFHRCTE